MVQLKTSKYSSNFQSLTSLIDGANLWLYVDTCLMRIDDNDDNDHDDDHKSLAMMVNLLEVAEHSKLLTPFSLKH